MGLAQLPVLGHRLHLGYLHRGGREAVPGHRWVVMYLVLACWFPAASVGQLRWDISRHIPNDFQLAPPSFPRSDQGSARPRGGKEGQEQQGRRRLKHHVCRGAAPALPARTLEVPQDRRHQVSEGWLLLGMRDWKRASITQLLTYLYFIITLCNLDADYTTSDAGCSSSCTRSTPACKTWRWTLSSK